MCLIVNDKIDSPTEPIIVYKVAKILENPSTKNLSANHKLFSPFCTKEIKVGWYKAEEELKLYKIRNNLSQINQGAIHCYTVEKEAKFTKELLDSFYDCPHIVLKCEAYPEDFVAFGIDNDVCYKQIFISDSEFNKIEEAISNFN